MASAYPSKMVTAKVPEKEEATVEKIEPTPLVIEAKHNFVPLWMGPVVFGAVIVGYVGAALLGYEVNVPREIATLAITGLAAVVCVYLKK